MKCDDCDHRPADCLSCDVQIFNGWDNDITLLDEWARAARTRDNRTLSDGLIMCADLLSGLTYCRTSEKMSVISNTLAGLRDDDRVRSIRERFRKIRIDVAPDTSRVEQK